MFHRVRIRSRPVRPDTQPLPIGVGSVNEPITYRRTGVEKTLYVDTNDLFGVQVSTPVTDKECVTGGPNIRGKGSTG